MNNNIWRSFFAKDKTNAHLEKVIHFIAIKNVDTSKQVAFYQRRKFFGKTIK